MTPIERLARVAAHIERFEKRFTIGTDLLNIDVHGQINLMRLHVELAVAQQAIGQQETQGETPEEDETVVSSGWDAGMSKPYTSGRVVEHGGYYLKSGPDGGSLKWTMSLDEAYIWDIPSIDDAYRTARQVSGSVRAVHIYTLGTLDSGKKTIKRVAR